MLSSMFTLPNYCSGYKVGDEVRCKVDEDDERFAYFHFKGKVTAVLEEGYLFAVHFDQIDVTDEFSMEFSVDEVRPALCPTILHAPAPATDAASPAHSCGVTCARS